MGTNSTSMIRSLTETCTSVYAGSPSVRWLQTNTMAVHGAAARMMQPAIYWPASPGLMKAENTTRKNSHANNAMENGFTSQFTTNVTNRPAGRLRTFRMLGKTTFIIMGGIISQIRTAMGTLIWLPRPNSQPIRTWTAGDRNLPISTPAAMDRATHNVRYRSKKAIRFTGWGGASETGGAMLSSHLRTACRTAAGAFRDRLHRTNEGAHELPVDFGRERLDVYPFARQELAGIFDAVDARGFDVD